MPSKVLYRLSSFAKWPMPSDTCSGMMMVSSFASKAAGAYFERTADSISDEVMCQSCAVQFSDWSSDLSGSDCKLYESPAAVHRVISPRCPALNPSDESAMTEDSLQIQIDSIRMMENPYARYLPSRMQTSSMTPEQSPHPSNIHRTARVQRVLFPEPQQRQSEEGSLQESDAETEIEIPQGAATSNAVVQPSILDQTPITHPFKPKSGNYDHLFASHRLNTFPQPIINTKYQTWAEEGFIFRREQQDVMCVYCGTVVVLNGHQPGVVHRKVCPSCPFVMGFDVGNISQQQEQCIRLVYFKQKAAKKHNNIEMKIRYVQYQNEEDRLGSFQGWPKMCDKIFPAHAMASAGLYYSGHSDKVICHSCGVELYDWSEDADVWMTHAAVSPTCLHVINSKGEDFITQALNQQVLAEVKYPKDSSCGGISGSSHAVGEEPGSSVLDMTAVKAALACGYTLPQIQHAIVKFFCQTSRYPNEAILKASLKAADENHITICRQQQVVQQKDTQLQQQGAQLQQQGAQLQQQGAQLQEKEQTVQTLQHQLDETVSQLDETVSQLNESYQQQLDEKDQLNESYQQQLDEKEEQLRWQDQQIQSLMQQVQRLRADRHHRAPLAAGPQGDGASSARPGIAGDGGHSLVCKICMSDKPRMIFLPCGHLFSCAECTSRLPDKRCPVCRQDISEVLPAFVA
ncbi:baculoviral IAP repeat-containing protein 3-like isoform X2 [Babylonia areolata]|uniref:baculoviral IAP repeat-containing protein 3-like isoform X2 n=1 Tax=Babylonia areolata TaxID=304850 RepID=UPI003FD5E74F